MKEFDFIGSLDENPKKGAQIEYIGFGEVGGKAHGLIIADEIVNKINSKGKYPSFIIDIPKFTVLRTGVFDTFMQMNDLYKTALSDANDSRIAHEFQKADLPFEILKDLRDLITKANKPLAIRSSSLLEDAKFEPFAGIYATKMLSNNQFDIDTRCRKLYEAVKLIYASAFFKAPKDYMKATKHDIKEEKMAVIIQEVIGRKHDDRFYPDISGVARSYNFYPMGRSKPEEGVVNLAVGLGKTIVDGGISWTYSPEDPTLTPPFGSVSDMLKNTQTEFWHIKMSEPEEYDPINETEFMRTNNIQKAEKDSAVSFAASTVSDSGRVTPGIGSDGPRIINFAPILKLELLPLNDIVKDLLKNSAEKFNTPVEIEFAVTTTGEGYDATGRFGFLQVRPMVVSDENVKIESHEIDDEENIVSSEFVLGNGCSEMIKDIVYVKPDVFDAKNTKKIAVEIEKFNSILTVKNRKYLLIGFGRWGSSDHWLGIPVNWSQISNVQTIVEAGLPNMNVELSQGSHFFHNMTCFGVNYFSVPAYYEYEINWNFLKKQKVISESENVVHVECKKPITIKVDGKTGRGIIKP
ncbi:MAG: PEP/pyruvate-binding domain-containing protein [Candidatus Delongbacteria bacterium]|nr:PEP/pyruvate-binding domain-containing protein [Candidatus Delongbacteria bacterium]